MSIGWLWSSPPPLSSLAAGQESKPLHLSPPLRRNWREIFQGSDSFHLCICITFCSFSSISVVCDNFLLESSDFFIVFRLFLNESHFRKRGTLLPPLGVHVVLLPRMSRILPLDNLTVWSLLGSWSADPCTFSRLDSLPSLRFLLIYLANPNSIPVARCPEFLMLNFDAVARMFNYRRLERLGPTTDWAELLANSCKFKPWTCSRADARWLTLVLSGSCFSWIRVCSWRIIDSLLLEPLK